MVMRGMKTVKAKSQEGLLRSSVSRTRQGHYTHKFTAVGAACVHSAQEQASMRGGGAHKDPPLEESYWLLRSAGRKRIHFLQGCKPVS